MRWMQPSIPKNEKVMYLATVIPSGFLYLNNYTFPKPQHLFLGAGKKGTGGGGNTGKGNKEKAGEGTGGKANERDLDAVHDEVALGTGKDGGKSEEGGGSHFKSTGNSGKKEGGGLDQEGGDAVDEELLVVGNEGEGTELLELGEDGLEGGKVDSVLLELGEDAKLGGLAEEVELTHTADDVVLRE